MDELESVRLGKTQRIFRSRMKLNYPGLVSHITQRATGREPLFLEDGDYLYFLKLLKKTSEDFALDVFAFALMPNHAHILLRQLRKNLSQAAFHLFRLYASFFNKKYGRKGHVFCDRFRQAACFGDRYLIAASLYIHLNPVRAGLVEDYQDYRWSSWRLYCRTVQRPTFVNWQFILNILSKDQDEARSRYRRLLDAGMRYRGRDRLEDKRSVKRFIVWLKNNYRNLIQPDDYSTLDGERSNGEEEELEKVVEYLQGKKRLSLPQDVQARRFAVEQLLARGFIASEIAGYLDISPSTVSRIIFDLRSKKLL